MYNATDIIAGWNGLIGWRQSIDGNGVQLEPGLLSSSSGMYFQDAHPLVRVEQLDSIYPKYDAVNYPAWLIATEYFVGSKVLHSSKVWISLTGVTGSPNVGTEPGTNILIWKEFNGFSDFVKNITEKSMIDVVNDYIEKKLLNKGAKAIIEEKAVFDVDNFDFLNETKQGKKVGWKIAQTKSKGVKIVLNRVSLCFSEAQTLTLKLYHSSRSTEVKSVDLVYTDAGEIQWFNLTDFVFSNFSTNHVGGHWVLEYDEALISGYAISSQKEFLFGSPDLLAGDLLFSFGSYVSFIPYKLPERNGANPKNYQYEYSRTLGLNLIVSVYCDYTQFFVRQRDLFKSCLAKKVAVNVLRELAYNASTRINQSEASVSKERILYEVDGDTQGRDTGLAGQYKQSLDSVMIDTAGIDPVCLPCVKKGVRYK